MTAPSPAIAKVSLNVNVDQAARGEIVLTQQMLGLNPYVVVEMSVANSALVLDVEVGGEEISMNAIGDALAMLSKTLKARGDSLTAQAKASDEKSVTLDMKASALFAEPTDEEPVDERKCTCDGGAYFTAEQNASRHPFLVNDNCPFHGKDTKDGTR